MRPLADLNFSQRCVVAVVTVLACLFLLAGLLLFAQAAPKEVDLYADIPPDANLLEIDKHALEEAYHQHLIKLFSVWLTDGAKDATRFKNGLSIARSAYHQAASQIAKREQEIKQRSQP